MHVSSLSSGAGGGGIYAYPYGYYFAGGAGGGLVGKDGVGIDSSGGGSQEAGGFTACNYISLTIGMI